MSKTNLSSGQTIPFYRDERFLRGAAQVISTVVIIGFLIWIVLNFLRAANARGLSLGYGFLSSPAGFPINDTVLPYSTTDSYLRAFLVGVLNTLRVSVLGVVLATIIGTFVALARLSSNWLMSRLALVYIEFHRNIPLLILLFIWYFTVFRELPAIKNSIEFSGPIYLNQRGLYLTWPRLNDDGWIFMVSALIGLIAAFFVYVRLLKRRELTGEDTHYVRYGLITLLVLPTIGWFLAGGAPFWLDVPLFKGFNIQGGLRFTPEFLGLFVSLVTYTSAFIAEIVRAGIQAVDRGQLEAANAVGLKPMQVLSLVIIPQALRIIIPPLISQYLNLTKNSSLALAIGYQELFSVGKIAINQAGRAVPVFLLIMISYLTISALTSLVLNIYNRRIQFAMR